MDPIVERKNDNKLLFILWFRQHCKYCILQFLWNKCNKRDECDYTYGSGQLQDSCHMGVLDGCWLAAVQVSKVARSFLIFKSLCPKDFSPDWKYSSVFKKAYFCFRYSSFLIQAVGFLLLICGMCIYNEIIFAPCLRSNGCLPPRDSDLEVLVSNNTGL